MVKKSSGFLAGAAAVLIKDITSEFRTRYAINALVMFSLVTLTVVSIAIGRSNLNYDLAAAFLWVIIFFSAISGLGQSFIKEEEARTIYALRLYANPLAVFAGKFIFNSLLLLFLELIFVPLFFYIAGCRMREHSIIVLSNTPWIIRSDWRHHDNCGYHRQSLGQRRAFRSPFLPDSSAAFGRGYWSNRNRFFGWSIC